MDIANIKPAPRTIEIKHPGTGENLGVRITVRSMDDDQLKGHRRMMQDRRVKAQTSGRPLKSADIEKQNNDFLFRCMENWEWYGEEAVFKGEKPAFNRENVMRVFDEPGLEWFRKQIDDEVGSTGDFFEN